MTNQEFIESIRLEGEEWRDVVGYDGLYLVSDKNRVASLITEIRDKNGRVRHRKQRLLSVIPVNRNGKEYYICLLTKNGVTLKKYMHKLIADAFIPNPNNYKEIDHIDRNGLNNSLENLRWVSHKMNQNNENTKRAMSLSRIGMRCPFRYKKIVQLKGDLVIKVFNSALEVAQSGFSMNGVINAALGRSKSSGGFRWMYLSDYENLVSMSKNSSTPGIDYPQ